MKKTIAVFFGGSSPEHDISIVTAISSVIKPLELTKKYVVVPVYITKSGAWYSDECLGDIATYRGGKIDDICATLKPISVILDGGLTIQKSGIRRQKIPIDIAFPAMHGGNGEDGSLMGFLRMAGIPFVGCDMPASVIAMDKVLAKQVAQVNNINVTKYEYLTRDAFAENPDKIIDRIENSLDFPLFVKPAHLGSSIGITRVTTRDELANAIEVAAYYDNKILVEEAVSNLIEVTVPIIGNRELEVALVERPLTTDDEVFDFDTKYMQGGKKGAGGAKQAGAQGYSELPADIPRKLYDEAVQTATAVYRAAECEGIARIDLLIDSATQRIYFNEINPLPGSLYSHNWRKAGVSSIELVTKLVEFAEQRHSEHQKIQTVFSTNFLKQF